MPVNISLDPAEPSGPLAIVSEFVDRGEESRATRAAMEHVEQVLRGGLEISAFEHVLTFYGGGGTGKSSLSRRLESWLKGKLHDDHWGPAPAIGNVVTVRWDLKSSKGDVDPLELLLSFRASLPSIPGGWKAFDLGLLSYFQAVRPGQSLDVTTSDTVQRSVIANAFDAVVGDLGHLLDVGTGIGSFAIQTAVTLVRKGLTAAQLRKHPRLAEIVDRCSSDEVTPTSPSPEVAAAVLGLADEEMAGVTDPAKRPLVVVFIDHFEYLQTDDRRPGETTVNALVGAIPQSLVVITGRNHLDWASPARTALTYRGPRLWPRLELGYAGPDPRQHRLGMLSRADTQDAFRRRALRQGFTLRDETVDRLVARTQGWPVHIDAICTLAAGITGGSAAEVSAEQLDQPLPDVVRRVLENLSEPQRRAYFGASLLPYFTVRLAAIAAGVTEGDVTAMLGRAMVEPSDDALWPYRVHDAIRGIIRTADPATSDGWAKGDWQDAAGRVLAHLRPLLAEASERQDDLACTSIASLAITIAAEHEVWEDWLGDEALARATPETLTRHVPTSSGEPNVDHLVRYLHARVMPRTDEAIDALQEIFASEYAVAKHAGLWRAYKLRGANRHDEALAALWEVRERFGDWSIPVSQIGITLNMARRFQDALDYAETVSEAKAAYIRQNQLRAMGMLFDERLTPFAERIRKTSAIRFRVELECAEGLYLARTAGCEPEDLEWRYRRAVDVGHAEGQRSSLAALALIELADPERFTVHMDGLLARPMSSGRLSTLAVYVQAMRALLTGDPDDALRARDLVGDRPFRGSGFIAVECLLDALGHPLAPVPTQWTVPYEEVSANWLGIADGVIERAKARAAAR